MKLSTCNELEVQPPGTFMGHCCGIVAKVCKSKAKTTVLMKCSTGQIFVVTAFATVVGKYGVFVELCQEGSVVDLNLLKIQAFDVKRFDGKKIYSTFLDYEFVVTSATIIKSQGIPVKKVATFKEMDSGGTYSFNCVLASTFFNIEENFCAIIADDDNKRADLNVLGNKEKDKFIEFAPGEEIEIKKGFVVIEDQCMHVKVQADDMEFMNNKKPVSKLLTTPVKHKKDTVKKD
nr:unnamed protein product [Meloidogyne enterolobii]